MRFLVVIVFLMFMIDAQATCAQGLEAFKNTLYPRLVVSCSHCHGDDGEVAQHSGSDPEAAYPIAQKFANFTQIEKSKFYKKVMAAHWLDYDENEKGMTVQEMDKYLNDWWSAGEKDCPLPFEFQSQEISIPDEFPLRSSGLYKKLTWDLGKTNPSFEGCEFGIWGQVFLEQSDNIPRSYRFKSPSLKCPSGTMKISRIRLLLDRNTQAFENNYDEIDTEIKHDGNEIILSDQMLILMSSKSSQGRLSIGIGKIKLRLSKEVSK